MLIPARLQPCGQIEDGKRIFFELATYSTAVIGCRMSVRLPMLSKAEIAQHAGVGRDGGI